MDGFPETAYMCRYRRLRSETGYVRSGSTGELPHRVGSVLHNRGSRAVLFISTAAFTVVAGARPSEYFGDVGGGFIQETNDRLYVILAALFGAISGLEIVAARWLRVEPTKGVTLAWVLLPPGFLLSIGFVLPIWLILDPIKAVLLITSGRSNQD